MIQVALSAAEIPIEPGSTAQLTVTITNKQAHDDHVFVEIEGIDVEWYALPVPALNVAAEESQCARVLFKIPRSSECHAGTYPFLVRARGMETGDAGIQQASLIVNPFSALQVELNPKRATATFLHHANAFEVTVSNLGNHEEALDLYASDPEDGCAYEFEKDRVTLKPGRAETVPLLIEPVTRPLLGAARLYGFAVTARSVEDSYVSGSVHGQLERRALLSALTAIILVALLFGAGLYLLFRPRPVTIHMFAATPMQVMAGDEVTLSWDVSNPGDRSVILPDNLPVREPIGSVKVRPAQRTTYVLVARGGGGREQKREITVDVAFRPPPPVLKPKIIEFNATQTRIHEGASITLSWKVQNADKIVLNPLDAAERDAKLYTSREIKPDHPTVYTLAVKSPSGIVVTKTLKIEVVEQGVSIAEIRSLRARPETIHPGETATLSWSVGSAVSIELDNGVGSSLPSHGKTEVRPQTTTIYTLKAVDDRGNATTQTVTVTVKPPEPPPADGTEPTEPTPKPPDDTAPKPGGTGR